MVEIELHRPISGRTFSGRTVTAFGGGSHGGSGVGGSSGGAGGRRNRNRSETRSEPSFEPLEMAEDQEPPLPPGVSITPVIQARPDAEQMAPSATTNNSGQQPHQPVAELAIIL